MDSNTIIKVGHFQADGGAHDLILGFVPDYIKLWNANAAATEVAIYEWFKDVGDAKGVAIKMIADNGATGNTNFNFLASGGAISKKEATTVQTTDPIKVIGNVGVTIDAAWMDDDDEIYYLAIKASEFKDHGDIA